MAGTANLQNKSAPPGSYGSFIVNGQLLGLQTKSAYSPQNMGGGVSGIPAASPMTVPPSSSYGYGAASPAAIGTASGASPGSGNVTANSQQRGVGSSAIKGSPALWALGLMAAGLLWLRFVHWRK